MTKLETFMTICLNTGLWMRHVNTIYGWSGPITPEHAYEEATCVTYAASCLQQGGYLPSGKYIHYSNGKLTGPGLAYIKAHPEKFEILHVKATPQKLGANLKRGDVCFYTVPHVMFYSNKADNGSPKWYSLERSNQGIGKPAKLTLSGVFGSYTRRRIEYIIRIKFDNGVTLMPAKQVEPKKQPSKLIRYKLKTGMNIRKSASAKSALVGYAPQGAVLTQASKTGNWIKTTYCGITGYVNVSSQYATKI